MQRTPFPYKRFCSNSLPLPVAGIDRRQDSYPGNAKAAILMQIHRIYISLKLFNPAVAAPVRPKTKKNPDPAELAESGLECKRIRLRAAW